MRYNGTEIERAVGSVVAIVVRCWALHRRVAGSNTGRVAVFAFLGKKLNLDCLSRPRRIDGYL